MITVQTISTRRHTFFSDISETQPISFRNKTSNQDQLKEASSTFQEVARSGCHWAKKDKNSGQGDPLILQHSCRHCVVYSSDGKRFEIPLVCLRTKVFQELLRMSREEFGFTGDGRITLPCDTATMEYVMCLLRREASEDVERALLSSIVITCHHPSRMMQSRGGLNQQFAVRSS